jgi:hypothetical protein
MMGLPSADDIRDATCVACPGQSLALGTFDVAPRPGPDHPFDPDAGHRISAATGTPTCVHPFRVGLPPAAYASAAVPLPADTGPRPEPVPEHLDLPDDPTLLEAWLVALIRTSPAPQLWTTLRRAETAAAEHFPPDLVVAALRRVLAAGG